MLGLFKKKDPICGMKQEKGKGIIDSSTGTWLCSEQCKEEFEKRKKDAMAAAGKPSCCQ